MPLDYRIQQNRTEVVSLNGWLPDDEFPFGPQGARPKRIVLCPNPSPYPFLIGGHRYLFKEPAGHREQQIWSEVIAYELGRDLGVNVPPAFLATGPGNGSPGVLIEFFHGYPFEPEQRFVNAVERLQGLNFEINMRRGSLKDNLILCRKHHIENYREWWSRTLSFDAIIGNTDRHSENWGLIVRNAPDGLKYSLAPTFDNGSSLGFIIREPDLPRYCEPEQLEKFVKQGKHHFGWIAGDNDGAQHSALCAKFVANSGSRNAMDAALELADVRIQAIVDWCSSFVFPVLFSPARGEFVAAQIRNRREALARSLGA